MSVRLAYINKVSSGALSQIIEDLEKLSELDMILNTLEGSFSTHFPGVLTASTSVPDAEIKSQNDMLAKARAGWKSAREMKARVAEILSAYPEDKIAQRAMADADKMLLNFEKHEKAAEKILRTLASKQMPKALKAYSKKVGSALKSKFVNPDQLEVVPWVQLKLFHIEDQWGRYQNIVGHRFSMIFRVNASPMFSSKNGSFQMTAVEDSVGDKGVLYKTDDERSLNDFEGGPEVFVSNFLGALRGWSGIKGDTNATAIRLSVAKQIAPVLYDVANSLGDAKKPEVDTAGLTVSVDFRTDLRAEDYEEYDDSWSYIGDRSYRTSAEKALASYNSKIQDVSLDYNEKGWWNLTVTLK